jgi:SAM-dependent methyltransferase
MDRREHWNRVYRTRAPDSVSWYQRRPDVSLELIAASGIAQDAGIIDIGGGASVLMDHLLDLGYSNLAVLDVSGAALDASRSRLGARAGAIEWFEADVTAFEPPHRYALWHDRAAFHFLTSAADRASYMATLRKTLKPGGTVVLATFALDGPPKCSGLDVIRYDDQSITTELGPEFALREVRREAHATPGRTEQQFCYFRIERRVAPDPARPPRQGFSGRSRT